MCLRKVSFYALLTVIIAIPFSKALVEVGFVLALAFWVLHHIIEYKKVNIKSLKRSDLLLLSLFFGLTFIATCFSQDKGAAFESLFSKVGEQILLFILVVSLFNQSKEYRKWVLFFLIGALVIIIDAFWQKAFGTDFLRGYEMLANYRIRASFGHTNHLAGWSFFVFFISLNLFIYHLSLFKQKAEYPILSFLGLMILLSFLTLIWTYTRGAWIAFFVSLLLWAMVKGKKARIGVFSFLCIAGIAVLFIPQLAFIKQRIYYIFNSQVEMRFILWGQAFEMWKDYPLFGVGLSNYLAEIKNYVPEGMLIKYAHNSYLQMFAEIGLFATLAFIAFNVYIFIRGLKTFFKMPESYEKSLLLGLLVSLFAFCFHASLDTHFNVMQLAMLLWFMMGMIISLVQWYEQQQ